MSEPSWPFAPDRDDVVDGHLDAGTIDQRLAEIWKAYPDPDEARDLAGTQFKRELLDGRDQVDDAIDDVDELLEQTTDLDELAEETGLDRYVLQRLVPRLEDDDRSNFASPAVLRARSEHAPDPIDALIDGDIPMVGTLPGSVRCGEHMIVRCQDCFDRWDNPDEYQGHPHPYTRTDRPAGCETPDCQECKQIYVPTRAAAVALRVQHYLNQVDEDVVLRHVVVSPPWRTLDELAHVHHGPISRDTIGQLETHVHELVEKKGAVASIVVRHPWRGWWGPSNPWRESWHWHVIAAFPRGEAPSSVTPHGWDREFVPGGKVCCTHREDPTGACCEGDCTDVRCPHHAIDEARSRVQSLSGSLGAAKREGAMTRTHRLRDRLDHAQDELAAAKQGACDRGWIVHVTETRDGEPKEVSTDPHELQGGHCEGLEVPAGVLALLQYDLDHVASVRDPQGATKLHTIKWFGDWSYRQLELRDQEKHALRELKEGVTEKECPNCGEAGLLPVHDREEVRQAVTLLDDPEIRAQRCKQRLVARQLGWLPDPGGNQSLETSDSHPQTTEDVEVDT